jgi:hypothetical protein
MTTFTPAQTTTFTPAAGNHAHPYRHSVPTLAGRCCMDRTKVELSVFPADLRSDV